MSTLDDLYAASRAPRRPDARATAALVLLAAGAAGCFELKSGADQAPDAGADGFGGAGGGVADGLGGADGDAGTPPVLSDQGYGRWCYALAPNRYDWYFEWGNADPCADLLQWRPELSIERAGLYSLTGLNHAEAICDGPQLETGFYWAGLTGDAALAAVFDQVSTWPARCLWLVSPAAMPIFDAPFAVDAASLAEHHVVAGYGFDFAVDPTTLDVTAFDQPGSKTATIVDRFGRDRSSAAAGNDADGHLWSMDEGTPIYAVADGIVVDSRDRDVSANPRCGQDGGGTSAQSEIYIRHDVGAGTYRESFVSAYAYLKERRVSRGETVTRGQLIGSSGHTGCAHGGSLLFTVTRLTNTIGWYQQTFATTGLGFGDNAQGGRVEPYGWVGANVADPWASFYRTRGVGAWSLNLWSGPTKTPPEAN